MYHLPFHSDWFPKLRTAHPECGPLIDTLEADHAALVKRERDILAGKYSALAAFVALLMDHLNREELLTVPFLMDGTGAW